MKLNALICLAAMFLVPWDCPGQEINPSTDKSAVSSKPKRERSSRRRSNTNDAFYQLGADSKVREGVPQGRFSEAKVIPSTVFPGTQHTYWVYEPALYDPAQPTAVMIFNDGQAMKAEPGDVQGHRVLDNLIYRREIPVMLGVFINPGRRPDQPEPTPRDWGDRTTNRADEYNPPNENYGRVIVEELMPALKKEYNISPDPELHGIMGSSSGGCAAFAVAWFRPNEFRKVITFVGSFTDIRGEHIYPELVAATEKKPIRIFMQDGRNDNRRPDNPDKDWFYQNVRLKDALEAKGYDVNYTWGIGNHGQKQGGAIFPSMMRWLWRDQPVSTDPNDRVERSFRKPTAAASSGFRSKESPTQAFDFRDAEFEDYSEALGHGWELGSTESSRRFSVRVPEGNHRVTVTLGNSKAGANTTIKAELRRLMLENFTTLPGESKDVTFIVNTRRPAFGGGREVRLKDREREGEWIAWDEKLTLEFIESTSAIQTLKIEPAPDLPTIFLLGDSTMCDQPSEPYASWGQMLPRFFESEVAVANHGESGESYSASSGRGRIDKIIDVMKLGDYLFLQFAHNDMKERGEGKGAFLNFKEGMIKHITAAREKGGIPVLITPMHRRRFDDQGKIINTFGDYPEAVRQTAKEQKVPLIDLLAMSAELYESLGPEGSAVLFKESDGTHHNNYGAYQLAKCVVNGIRDQLPDAARGLKQDLKAYAPGNPDPLDSFRIPASSTQSTRKPDGK